MPDVLTLILAQLSPRLRHTKANLETMGRIVAEQPEADLVVFPELYLSGYTLSDVDELAVQMDSPELERVTGMARESSTAVIFGAPERISGGIANSAFCVDEQGTIAAVYRKVQLYWLKMGIMICFDVEFPEVARSFARVGAEMLVTISANMEPFGNDHAVFASARALENGLPHAYVNQVGPGEKNLTFVGGSTVVSPDGEIYAQAGSSEEAMLSVRLLPAKSNLREDYLSQLRSPMPSVRTVPSSVRTETRT